MRNPDTRHQTGLTKIERRNAFDQLNWLPGGIVPCHVSPHLPSLLWAS
jgi:hypothetical protein